jgi:hypothetical protein
MRQDLCVRFGLVFLALSVLVVGAACDSTRHDAAIVGATSGPAACDVLTAADASRAVGEPVQNDTGGLHLPRWACHYQTGLSGVTLELYTSSASHLTEVFRALRDGSAKVSVVPPATRPTKAQLRAQVISRVGDEALWDGQTLEVEVGSTFLDVAVQIDNRPSLARSVAAARLALPVLSVAS